MTAAKRTLSFVVTAMLATSSISMTAGAMPENDRKDASSAAQTPHSVLAFNQKLAGTAVKLSYVRLPSDGYAVIYGSDSGGKHSGPALGYVALGKGDHRDIAVEVSGPPKPGSVLWAALYKDVDGDKKFDAKKDKRVGSAELPLENRFEVNG